MKTTRKMTKVNPKTGCGSDDDWSFGGKEGGGIISDLPGEHLHHGASLKGPDDVPAR